MNTSRLLIIFAAILSPAVASTDKWQHFQDMPESKGTYETILIETKGIFSKEVIIWLRASYNLGETKCNNAYSDSSSDSSFENAYQNANQAGCIARAKNEPKESIYKLSLNCSNKTVNYLQVSSKNHFDKPVTDSASIGDYPGSLGFSLIQHYCQ